MLFNPPTRPSACHSLGVLSKSVEIFYILTWFVNFLNILLKTNVCLSLFNSSTILLDHVDLSCFSVAHTVCIFSTVLNVLFFFIVF